MATKSPRSTRTELDFFEALQDQVFCDAILRTQDGFQIKIHRNVISNKSPYFHALFSNGTTHKITDGLQDVTIPSVSGNILSLVVDFMYTEDRSKITLRNIEKLAVAADYLDVPNLRLACSDFMMDNLNAANAIGIMRFAHFNNYMDLYEKVKYFVTFNFERITEQCNCEELMETTAEELADILGDDRLNVKQEMLVWRVVKQWLEQDPVNRQNQVAIPFEKLRCSFLDETDFAEVATFARKYWCTYGGLCPARLPPQILLAIGGWSFGEPSNIIESWDSRTDVWHTVTGDEPMGRIAYHGCVVIKDQIFLIGGYDGVEYYNHCQKFCTTTKTWTEVAPMHNRRCYVSVARTEDDMIYAMGGYDGINRQNSVERYDYRTNQWTVVAPMTVQRSDADAAYINGKIYVVGGFDGHHCLDTAEVYNTRNNIWTLISTTMSCRRSGVSCIAAEGSVYVIGGYDGHGRLATAERFELRTSTWKPIASMTQGRSNFAVEVVEGCILAIGGFNGTTTISEVEQYKICTNTWEPVKSMNVRRSALFACAMVPRNLSDYLRADRHLVLPCPISMAYRQIMDNVLTSSLPMLPPSPQNASMVDSEGDLNDSMGL